MKFSKIGQEKCAFLIEVTLWAGLTVLWRSHQNPVATSNYLYCYCDNQNGGLLLSVFLYFILLYSLLYIYYFVHMCMTIFRNP